MSPEQRGNMDGPVYARRFPSWAYLLMVLEVRIMLCLRRESWYLSLMRKGHEGSTGPMCQYNIHTGVWELLLQSVRGSQRSFPPSFFFFCVPTSWHFINFVFSSSLFHLHINLFAAFLASAVSVKAAS